MKEREREKQTEKKKETRKRKIEGERNWGKKKIGTIIHQ